MTFPLTAPMFDLLVLSVTANADAYGYEISQIIKQASNMKDSTLYPILRRLLENEYLTTYDQQFQGRNRKYYSITDEGRKHQQHLEKEWDGYKQTIDQIIKGGTHS